MGRIATVVLGVLMMVAMIIALDVLFLRDHIWLRLVVNVAIVAVFGAIYLTYRNRL